MTPYVYLAEGNLAEAHASAKNMSKAPIYHRDLMEACTAAQRPADLAKIERSIAREPAYQSRTPKYCLLVFGPEAKTHIWLVLDGDKLYVDKNGNGDLTDDGPPVAAKVEPLAPFAARSAPPHRGATCCRPAYSRPCHIAADNCPAPSYSGLP